jgi:hypothetical protein
MPECLRLAKRGEYTGYLREGDEYTRVEVCQRGSSIAWVETKTDLSTLAWATIRLQRQFVHTNGSFAVSYR